jgi:hypothetical protein
VTTGERREDRRQVFDLIVQWLARVLAQHGGDIAVELSVLAVQGHDRDADDREDETQTTNVLAQFDRE